MKNKNKTYTFDYNIGDKVRVKDLNLKGRISGILIDSGGLLYKVRYFYESKPNEVFFEEGEIELINDEGETLHFKG